MLAKCPKCRTGKKIMGMGMLLIDCPECEGEGYVTVDKIVAKDVQDEKEAGSTKSSKSNKKSSSKETS